MHLLNFCFRDYETFTENYKVHLLVTLIFPFWVVVWVAMVMHIFFKLTVCFICKYRISLLIVILRNEKNNTEFTGTSGNDKHIFIKHLHSFYTELII